ncbi:MAG: hypothetical protein J0M02_01505 [Planctomycetes bacterium]|nr:hypothetical protein [Planctomycetota bacterium]
MTIPLARLTTADLDPMTLTALFSDLATLVEIDEVLIKGDATAYAGATGLGEAQRALAAGARGIQIRYRWAGEGWLDTLMSGPGGIRLVRSQTSPTPSQEQP